MKSLDFIGENAYKIGIQENIPEPNLDCKRNFSYLLKVALNDNSPLAGDILRGAAAIAAFLGFDRRAVYHVIAKGQMPVFRLGDTICARRSTLTAWIAEQEQAARAAA